MTSTALQIFRLKRGQKKGGGDRIEAAAAISDDRVKESWTDGRDFDFSFVIHERGRFWALKIWEDWGSMYSNREWA